MDAVQLILNIVALLASACSYSKWVNIWNIRPTPGLTGNFISYPYSGNVKYFIVACFRSEGYYLEDWIKYHLALGFDGIYLCDNNIGDSDLEYVAQVSAQFPQVKVINKRNLKYEQEKWYVEIYKQLSPGDWCLFIDIDEFLTFTSNMSLYHYMSLAGETPCKQIKVNQVIYGNNKEIFLRPGSVRDRFPKPSIPLGGTLETVRVNKFVKPLIVGGQQLRFPIMHYACGPELYSCASDFVEVDAGKSRIPPIYAYAYIRHYHTRSEQEYCLKMQKWKNHTRYGKNYKWARYDESNMFPGNQIRTGIIGDDCKRVIQ